MAMINMCSIMPTIFDVLYREFLRARLAEMRKQLLLWPGTPIVPEENCEAGHPDDAAGFFSQEWDSHAEEEVILKLHEGKIKSWLVSTGVSPAQCLSLSAGDMAFRTPRPTAPARSIFCNPSSSACRRQHTSSSLYPLNSKPLRLLRLPTIIGANSLSRSKVVIMPGTGSWQLRDGEQIIACNGSLLGHRHFLIGITRVRNEALILRDTLDYVGKHVDAIVAYDDASTDRTLEILGGHPKVALIVTNRSWEADIAARRIAEGRHRGLLLQTAREHLQFDWMFCFDADERVTGDLRGYMERTHSSDCDGVRVQLFDAYIQLPVIMHPIKPIANYWTFVASSARNGETF